MNSPSSWWIYKWSPTRYVYSRIYPRIYAAVFSGRIKFLYSRGLRFRMWVLETSPNSRVLCSVVALKWTCSRSRSCLIDGTICLEGARETVQILVSINTLLCHHLNSDLPGMDISTAWWWTWASFVSCLSRITPAVRSALMCSLFTNKATGGSAGVPRASRRVRRQSEICSVSVRCAMWVSEYVSL